MFQRQEPIGKDREVAESLSRSFPSLSLSLCLSLSLSLSISLSISLCLSLSLSLSISLSISLSLSVSLSLSLSLSSVSLSLYLSLSLSLSPSLSVSLSLSPFLCQCLSLSLTLSLSHSLALSLSLSLSRSLTLSLSLEIMCFAPQQHPILHLSSLQNGSARPALASVLFNPPLQKTFQKLITILLNFSTFSLPEIFFLLPFSFLIFFRLRLFSDSSHLCFSICPYCQKFDF